MQTRGWKGTAVAPPPANARGAGAAAATFRLEGEYWTIAYDGTVFRLRHTKGLHCVAYLLGRPGEDVRATDLLNAAGKHSQPSPDPSSPQTLPANLERQRILVTKHIKAATRKIAAQDASLGHHFGTCIKTGSACSYRPDPARPIAWKL